VSLLKPPVSTWFVSHFVSHFKLGHGGQPEDLPGGAAAEGDVSDKPKFAK
jgi:hypothetical protein